MHTCVCLSYRHYFLCHLCLFSFMCAVCDRLESTYSICVCVCVPVCAITRLAALRRLIQPRYLGGDPYGRRQSDVDGITATLVLMRSSLALMSDRMTVRGGPHGSHPGRKAGRQEASRHKQTHIYICTYNKCIHRHTYTQYKYRDVLGRVQESNIFQRLLPTFSAV